MQRTKRRVERKQEIQTLKKNPTELELRVDYFLSNPEINSRHKKIFKLGIAREIIVEYVNGASIEYLSSKYELSYPTVHKFITDFHLVELDEREIRKVVYEDLSKHANVLASFFSGVAHLSQDMAFNALLSKRLREELSKVLFEKGILGVLEEKKLLLAWQSALKRTETIINQINQQTSIYLSLLEKILDKQRETAFISTLYRIMSELDPEIAYKLQEALYKDDYARALLEAQNTEELIGLISEIFSNKQNIQKSKEVIETTALVLEDHSSTENSAK